MTKYELLRLVKYVGAVGPFTIDHDRDVAAVVSED